MKILFICTGNICRSPAGEGVLTKMCADNNLDWTIDSAGVGSWHVGDPPDSRAQEAARSRGYDISMQKARALSIDDYHTFDRIYGMTAEHCQILRENAPANSHAEILLFMESYGKTADVPDPYYGNEHGFENMMDIIEEGCRAIIAEVTKATKATKTTKATK